MSGRGSNHKSSSETTTGYGRARLQRQVHRFHESAKVSRRDQLRYDSIGGSFSVRSSKYVETVNAFILTIFVQLGILTRGFGHAFGKPTGVGSGKVTLMQTGTDELVEKNRPAAPIESRGKAQMVRFLSVSTYFITATTLGASDPSICFSERSKTTGTTAFRKVVNHVENEVQSHASLIVMSERFGDWVEKELRSARLRA